MTGCSRGQQAVPMGTQRRQETERVALERVGTTEAGGLPARVEHMAGRRAVSGGREPATRGRGGAEELHLEADQAPPCLRTVLRTHR